MVQWPSPTAHERARPIVLVIDDVDATRTGLVELLRLRGYDALNAASGAEGLRMLREDPRICAVVLDLLMPGTNGYWFREQQLTDPSIAGVPVIVFTGAGKEEAEITARLKVSDVLFKPLSVDRLLQAISRYCEP